MEFGKVRRSDDNRPGLTPAHSISHCYLHPKPGDLRVFPGERVRPSLGEHFGKPQGIKDCGACQGVVEVGVHWDLPLERVAGQ